MPQLMQGWREGLIFFYGEFLLQEQPMAANYAIIQAVHYSHQLNKESCGKSKG
jgi:hypothetical protein